MRSSIASWKVEDKKKLVSWAFFALLYAMRVYIHNSNKSMSQSHVTRWNKRAKFPARMLRRRSKFSFSLIFVQQPQQHHNNWKLSVDIWVSFSLPRVIKGRKNYGVEIHYFYASSTTDYSHSHFTMFSSKMRREKSDGDEEENKHSLIIKSEKLEFHYCAEKKHVYNIFIQFSPRYAYESDKQ